MQTAETKRLEELRIVLRSESISWGELAELESLAAYIDPGDVELLEAAGVPESSTDSFDWTIVQDGGVSDRFESKAEAIKALADYDEPAEVVYSPEGETFETFARWLDIQGIAR